MWAGVSQVENFPGSYRGHRGKLAVMNRLRFGSEAPLLAPGEKRLPTGTCRMNRSEEEKPERPSLTFLQSSYFSLEEKFVCF